MTPWIIRFDDQSPDGRVRVAARSAFSVHDVRLPGLAAMFRAVLEEALVLRGA